MPAGVFAELEWCYEQRIGHRSGRDVNLFDAWDAQWIESDELGRVWIRRILEICGEQALPEQIPSQLLYYILIYSSKTKTGMNRCLKPSTINIIRIDEWLYDGHSVNGTSQPVNHIAGNNGLETYIGWMMDPDEYNVVQS
jgi:hypothetical protein